MNKKEIIKNIILTVLIISTCVLTLFTWGYSGNLLRDNGQYIIITVFGKQIPVYFLSAQKKPNNKDASPRLINLETASLKIEGRTYFVSDASLPGVELSVGGVLSRADGSEFKKDSPEKYKAALESDFLLFDFGNNFPFELVYDYFEPGVGGVKFSYPVRFMLINPDSRKIFVKNSITGAVYSMQSNDLKSLLSPKDAGDECVFFGEYEYGDNAGYEKVPYERTVRTGQLKYSTLYYKNPFSSAETSSDVYNKLPRAFGFNPFTSNKYPEADMTKVAVENTATLKLKTDGTVDFKVLNYEKGYLPEGGDPKEVAKSYTAMASQAGALMTSLSNLAYENAAVIKLSAVSYSERESGYKFYFDYYLNGVKINYEDRAAAAVITFRQGLIVSANIRPSYYSSGDTSYSLPLKQAIAAFGDLSGREATDIEQVYINKNDGSPMKAVWAVKTERR